MTDTAELKRLLAAATPGGLRLDPFPMEGIYDEKYHEIASGPGYAPYGFSLSGFISSVDAALIVALHNAAPALIEELEALRARVAELEELQRAVQRHVDDEDYGFDNVLDFLTGLPELTPTEDKP